MDELDQLKMKIFEDLQNQTRYAIYKILEDEKEVKAFNLLKKLEKLGIKSYYGAIMNHLRKMAYNSGVIELTKKEGHYYVKLKKRIKIKVEELSEK
jgi:predicted enzyme involved in methoxymalonyl-ACP biosynthesis